VCEVNWAAFAKSEIEKDFQRKSFYQLIRKIVYFCLNKLKMIKSTGYRM